jgi:nucleoid DNA-binding protein
VNPQDGSEIHIPEMPMPRFRAGKLLKETVR